LLEECSAQLSRGDEKQAAAVMERVLESYDAAETRLLMSRLRGTESSAGAAKDLLGSLREFAARKNDAGVVSAFLALRLNGGIQAEQVRTDDHLAVARSLMKLGRPQLALAVLKERLEHGPPDGNEDRVLYHIALCYATRLKNRQKADVFAQALCRFHPASRWSAAVRHLPLCV
jgi:tetratricopeptide (TPR) repeat protein